MAQQDDAYDLRELFEEIEDDLIQNLQRNLKRHEREEEKEGFRWEMWQKAKLRNIRKFRAENRQIINEHSLNLGQKIHDAITGTFQSIKSAWDRLIEALNPRIHAPEDQSGRGLDQKAEPEENFFGINREKIKALQETAEFHPEGKEKKLPEDEQEKRNQDLENQVSKDFQQVEYAIWRSMDDVYRRTVYRAGMFLGSGTKTLDQAIDMATAEFLRNGICCIEYKDGKRVNVASYAEMALRTAQQRARLLADGKARDEMGVHTIVVSAHMNTCELCAPWQGQILIDDVYSHGTREESNSTGYPLLSDAIRAGLLHPNCRHTLSTYFPGITQQPTIPDQKQAIITYKAQQEQRALERMIRKWKRVMEGSCDAGNRRYANERLVEYGSKLDGLLRDHPELRRAPNREKTRNIPMEQLDSELKRDIIKSELLKRSIKGEPSWPPRIINVESLTFDDQHVNKERQHNVTEEEAKGFIKNAVISLTVWNGNFERYFSKNGAAYVDLMMGTIVTAFKENEYDKNAHAIMEVIERYG